MGQTACAKTYDITDGYKGTLTGKVVKIKKTSPWGTRTCYILRLKKKAKFLDWSLGSDGGLYKTKEVQIDISSKQYKKVKSKKSVKVKGILFTTDYMWHEGDWIRRVGIRNAKIVK